MPGHFVSFGTYAGDNGAVHYSSFARGCYHKFTWERSPIAFDLPMDSLSREGDAVYMDHDAMVSIVEQHPVHYHGRVYRNYDHDLDLYIKFAADDYIYKYKLAMRPISTTAGADPDDPYPAPVQYYLATGKTYETRFSPAEWESMTDYGAPAMPSGSNAADETIGAADAADETIAGADDGTGGYDGE